MELFQFLLMPVLWDRPGNITPLVRLIQAYISRGARQIIALDKVEALLGVFQKLIASKSNDHEGRAFMSVWGQPRGRFSRLPQQPCWLYTMIVLQYHLSPSRRFYPTEIWLSSRFFTSCLDTRRFNGISIYLFLLIKFGSVLFFFRLLLGSINRGAFPC